MGTRGVAPCPVSMGESRGLLSLWITCGRLCDAQLEPRLRY
jgi:hypothetical protein